MTAAHGIVFIVASLILLACRYDTRRRHSPISLFIAVACGFAAMSLIGACDDAWLHVRCVADSKIVKAAVIALTEESGKLATIYLVALTLLRRRIQDPLDGLLIGQMIGLGMAVNESILYLSLQPDGLRSLGGEIVRLFAHSLMAGVVGFGVGGQRSLPRRQGWRCLLLCVGLTASIHFDWNAIAYGHAPEVAARLMPMLLMLTLMLLWKTFCTIAQRHAADWPLTTALPRTA